MQKPDLWHYRTGEWALSFNPRDSTLECRHLPSGTRAHGTLQFQPHIKDQAAPWQVITARDSYGERLSLLVPGDQIVGYVTFQPHGGWLQITATRRAWLDHYEGELTFSPTVTLNRQTFACRTQNPGLGNSVVQMASGPADSDLNDSLFDVENDTVFHFDADYRQIRTLTAKKNIPRFDVQLRSRLVEEAAAIGLTIEPDYYRRRYVPWYRPIDRKRCPEAPSGWMSWNTYFDKAGEAENLAEARVGAKYFKTYGLKIWSIESWQEGSDSQPCAKFAHLTLRPYQEQFPHGMAWLARQIRRLGFRPGIWSVPFGTGDKEFYLRHKSWFLHNPQGVPMTNWCGHFLIDPSQAPARRWIENTYRIMSHQWKYEFFKIDGMSASNSAYSAMFYELPEVRAAFRNKIADPYEKMIRAFKQGMGERAIMLACGGAYSGPDPSVVDAGRIGHDIVSMNCPPTWRGYYLQALTTLANLFTNNITWYTDPDTLLVGTATALPTARLAATVVALPGQVNFFGDKLGDLPPERRWLLQRTLPVCDVRPLDLFPIYRPCSTWVVKVRRPFGAWDVVSLFNFDETGSKTLGFTFAEIGLDPKADYLIYDYWNSRFLGRFKDRFDLTVNAQSNALLAVHPDLNRPQFLSTDRHLTQGATCLEAMEWDDRKRVLTGKNTIGRR